MQNTYLLILLNLTLSAILTGLIWTIQIVHYPGFLGVGVEKFIAYQHNHMRTISYLVIPLMVTELGLAVWLQFFQQNSLPRITYLATAMVLVIWLSTFFISSRLHGKLSTQGYDPQAIQQLVATNWIRTVAWSVRTSVLFYIVIKVAKGWQVKAKWQRYPEKSSGKIYFNNRYLINTSLLSTIFEKIVKNVRTLYSLCVSFDRKNQQ